MQAHIDGVRLDPVHAGAGTAIAAADDVDEGPRCRICWESEPRGQLISPCKCAGSMAHIHVECLRRLLNMSRDAGRPRAALWCGVCRGRYDAELLRSAAAAAAAGAEHAEGGSRSLLPRLWQDPYVLATLLHGALRVYVAGSGLLHAYRMYRSIQAGTPLPQPLPSPSQRLVALPTCTAGANASPTSAAPANPSGVIGGVTGGSRRRAPPSTTAAQAGAAVPQPRLAAPSTSLDVVEAVRERFDSATMVQVR